MSISTDTSHTGFDASPAQLEDARTRHPDRVINVGIREQLLLSVGGGLALAGMPPVLHTFPSFLVDRPYEQIKLDVNHQGVGALLVSAGASYDMTTAGRTHQSPGDVAILDTLPGNERVYLRLSEAGNAEPLPSNGMRVVRRGSRGVVLAVGRCWIVR